MEAPKENGSSSKRQAEEKNLPLPMKNLAKKAFLLQFSVLRLYKQIETIFYTAS